MAWIGEIVLAILCVLGASGVLWLLFGMLTHRGPVQSFWVLLEGRGSGAELEEQLQYLAWLRQAGLFQGSAVVLDAGLDRMGRELALRLALRWPWVTCCPAGSLEEWVAQRRP